MATPCAGGGPPLIPRPHAREASSRARALPLPSTAFYSPPLLPPVLWLHGLGDSGPANEPCARRLFPPASIFFVLWLHGLGDSGPANEPIRNLFSAPEFRLAKWSFPSAPRALVSCNNGFVMPSWFDIHELPMNAGSPQDEAGVLKAMEKVHAMIDREVADGIHPENIFVCGFSQGGKNKGFV